jgi:hypothetical protein
MPKLMHATRRGGPGSGEIILVNGAKLELDENGCVEATVEQAAKLLQGGLWRDPEHWAKHPKAPVAAPAPAGAPAGGRRVRTQAELSELAAAEGVPQSEEPTQVEGKSKRGAKK